MTKILFVQGMNSATPPKKLEWYEGYFAGLQRLLRQVGVAESALPKREDMDLLYWTDLVPDTVEPITKGLVEDFEAQWIELCRRVVLAVDARGQYDMLQTPFDPISRNLRGRIAQTALYMGDYAAREHVHPHVSRRLRDQVLETFNQKLADDTRIVIGHSLGSVIAYEGLRTFPHRVDLLLTVGSPIATPRLIYERLEGRSPYEWPGSVKRWCNVYCELDAWFVPVPRLHGLFQGQIDDIAVRHGSLSPREAGKTHDLRSYLKHDVVGHLIADAWSRT